MEDNVELQIGDVVRLKSGSAKMTVADKPEAPNRLVDCICYHSSPDGSDGRFEVITVHPGALVKVAA